MFKTLAALTVWILFLFGAAAIISGFARAFSHASLSLVAFYFGYGIASLFLSVVCAWLKKKLE